MWNVHRRSGTVELCRLADGQVVMEQTRPSDGGGDVGRPWPERASSRSRAGKRSLGARQTPVLAVDISLPRHHDYRQVELVRLRGYKWLVDRCAIMMWGLCLQRWPARRFRGQRPAPLYNLTSPPRPSLEEEWGRGESMAVCVECVVGDL